MERKLSIRKTRLRVLDPFPEIQAVKICRSEFFYIKKIGPSELNLKDIVSPFAGAAWESSVDTESPTVAGILDLLPIASISDYLP